MSNHSHLKSRAAAGAALVALSGFVPQPLIGTALAAVASLPLQGTFISGITLTAGNPIDFGSMVASATGGKAVLSTAGVNTPTKGVAIGGAAVGTIKFKAASTTPNVDITVSKMGPLTLAKTAGNNGPAGTAKLTKVALGAIGAAAADITAAGTIGKKLGYNITTKSANIKVGGTITWGAVRPIGAFTQNIVVTIAY